ncbi:hypothetical protein QQM79_07265 [Marinobacteraceae bacterium S3BR75-40.1]
MPRLLTLLALLALLCFAITAHAEPLKDKEAVGKATDQFLTAATDGDIAKAYAGIRNAVGVDVEAFDNSGDKAAGYFKKVFEQVGKPLAWDRVRTEHIKDHLLRITYLQKFQQAALFWEFTFYQPTEGWSLVNISYGTDLSHLYEPVK